MRSLVEKIKTPSIPSPRNLSELEILYKMFANKYVGGLDELMFHSFEAYVSLQNSYREINNLIVEIDRALESVFGTKINKVKGDIRNMSLEKFVHLFIKYNPLVFETLSRAIFQTCEKDEALKKLKVLNKQIANSKIPGDYSNTSLRILVEVEAYLGTLDEIICSRDNINSFI